jgi:hypothetical protein
MIIVILYLSYLIVNYKYKEYKINNHIEYIKNENKKTSDEIIKSKDSLEYLNTNAYKNKVLEEEQAMKDKGEVVIFITNEEKYNMYTKKESTDVPSNETYEEKQIYDSMNINEKWIYFIFKKDIR